MREQRVRTKLYQGLDNYLRALQHHLTEQSPGTYVLRAGKIRETHGVYACSLQSLKLIRTNLAQRTGYFVMVDSTIPCDLPYDNVVPDVMVVTMPLSHLPEVSEVVVSIFAQELEGSLKTTS